MWRCERARMCVCFSPLPTFSMFCPLCLTSPFRFRPFPCTHTLGHTLARLKNIRRLFEGNAILRRLVRIGVLDQDRMKLDFVLGLKVCLITLLFWFAPSPRLISQTLFSPLPLSLFLPLSLSSPLSFSSLSLSLSSPSLFLPLSLSSPPFLSLTLSSLPAPPPYPISHVLIFLFCSPRISSSAAFRRRCSSSATPSPSTTRACSSASATSGECAALRGTF